LVFRPSDLFEAAVGVVAVLDCRMRTAAFVWKFWREQAAEQSR
jgi:hypothetical protein